MIALSARDDMLAAMARAHRIVFADYLLGPGRVRDALVKAAERGARVSVRLPGPGKHVPAGVSRVDANSTALLRKAGVDAAPVDGMHMKAVVCDGVAYLDDRNWTAGDDTILRDRTPRDVAAIRTGALGQMTRAKSSIATAKSDALALECGVLGGAHKSVCAETESFSYHGPVYASLKRLASAGVRCRLIVTRTTDKDVEHAVKLMRACGVQVRESRSTEKLAVADRRNGWVGSANATSPYYDGADWGTRTRSVKIVNALQRRFEQNWRAATAFTR